MSGQFAKRVQGRNAENTWYLHSTHGSVEMLVGSELLAQSKVDNFYLGVRRLVRKHNVFEFQITMDNTCGANDTASARWSAS